MNIQAGPDPVRQIKGVSARKEEELHAFGIRTAADLMEYFPFRYEDYRVRELEEVGDGEKATIQGKIAAPPVVQRYGGKTRMSCRVAAGRMLITAVWFNRHFLKDQLTPGRDITLTGKWDRHRRQLTVAESEFPDRGASKTGTLQPVYSVGGGITQSWMRKTIAQALQQFGHLVPEVLPQELIQRHGLMPRAKR